MGEAACLRRGLHYNFHFLGSSSSTIYSRETMLGGRDRLGLEKREPMQRDCRSGSETRQRQQMERQTIGRYRRCVCRLCFIPIGKEVLGREWDVEGPGKRLLPGAGYLPTPGDRLGRRLG